MATPKQIFIKGLGAAGVFNGDQKSTSPEIANSTAMAKLKAVKAPVHNSGRNPAAKLRYLGLLK